MKILLGVFIALVGRWLSHKHDGKVLESWTVKLTNKYMTIRSLGNCSSLKRFMVVIFPLH